MYVNLCKPFTHEIVYKGTNIIADWAFIDAELGCIKIEPYVGVDLGIHELTLVTTLALYDVDVVNFESFTVDVYDCIPTVFSNGASIPDIYYKWGFIEKTFDASTMLNGFTQSPQCGYPIIFEAFRYESDGYLTPLDEVVEVKYYDQAGVFGFQKCGPSSGPDDECLDTEYTKTIPIRLVAHAGSSDKVFLDFSIIFEPDCTKDTIHFHDNEQFADIPYYIQSPASSTTITPIFTQKIPECELSCKLSENMELWDPVSSSTIISQFSLGSGELVVNTGDISKDNTKVLLVVECTSVDSIVSTTDGSPERRDAVSFRASLYDHCRRVDLAPALISKSQIDTELFETLYTDFDPAYIVDGSACSDFEYIFKSPSLSAPSFTISNGQIKSEPTDFSDEVGFKEFLVEACLVNYKFDKINCVNSEIAQYYILDPCERTEILVNNYIPDDMLAVYQGGQDVIPEFLTSINFPDTESIRIYNKGYPRDVCGQNGYSFVSQLTNQPVPFMN